MPTQLVVLGETFEETALSPATYELLEDATTYRWSAVFIMMRAEAKALRHGSAVLLSQRLDITVEDALAKLDGLTMSDFVFSEVEDDLPTAWQNGRPTSADEE